MTTTASANLSTSEYVLINAARKPMYLQSHGDAVRLIYSADKPSVNATAFHILRGSDPILPVDFVDTSVWALATSDHCSLAVTETVNAKSLQPVDISGNESRNTITQEQLVAMRTDNINVQFQYNVPVNEDSGDVDSVTSGTGSISHQDSMAVVSSGTGVGFACVESKDSIRYFPGHEFAAEMTAFSLPDSVGSEPNTYARWGIGDVNGVGDAMTFAVVDGVFGAVFRSEGVEQFIPQSDFNLDKLDGTGPSGFDINSDKLDLYTFRGGWYGILPLTYGVFATRFGYITAHIIDETNTVTSPHLSNPTLPMFIEAGRTSGTGSDIQVKSASWRGGISGQKPESTLADRKQIVTIEEKTISANADVPIITLKNKTTFQGKTNHVRVRYGTLSIFTDGNKPVIFKVFKNGTLTGENFNDKNPATSVVEYDVDATAYTPSTDPVGGVVMGKVDTTRINLLGKDDVVLAAYPGETITLTARSSNSSDITMFFRWVDEF